MFTICLQIIHTLFITDLYNILKDKGKGYSKKSTKVLNMKRYIQLNNEDFVIKQANGILHPNKQVRLLSDCYAKPSLAKQAIFDSWVEWVKQVNLDNEKYILKHLTIGSYNCMIFTLSIDVYNLTSQLVGKLYITKTRHEFWTI